MYRGQRPNWLARMLNRVDAALGSSGVGAKHGLVTLEVTGHTSGQTVSLPVALIVVNGEWYLVSMLGEDVQWVKNVRAAGEQAVLRSRGRKEVLLEEVPTPSGSCSSERTSMPTLRPWPSRGCRGCATTLS
jgi:hypothetical protein